MIFIDQFERNFKIFNNLAKIIAEFFILKNISGVINV